MKLLAICAAILVAIVIFGLLQGWVMTWETYTDEELEEMRVRFGRKENEREQDVN